MRFIKKNFVYIFLFIACLATGILALATALRLREFKTAAPAKTSALTPPCSLTFTIEDDTPRKTAQEETTLVAQQPTLTLVPTLKPTLSPTPSPTLKPTVTITNPPVLSPTPSPTKSLIAQGTTTAPTPTITKIVEPNLPVSGTDLPTIGAFLLGFFFLSAGLYKGLRVNPDKRG